MQERKGKEGVVYDIADGAGKAMMYVCVCVEQS